MYDEVLKDQIFSGETAVIFDLVHAVMIIFLRVCDRQAW